MNRLMKNRIKGAARNIPSNFADLDFDQLESRTMLAGDVTAVLDGNVLKVTGDNAANAVVVVQVGNAFAVVGFDGTTTVNGQAAGTPFIVASGVQHLDVNLGNGADVAVIQTPGLVGNLNLNAGSGDDFVVVQNSAIAGEANIRLGGAGTQDAVAVINSSIGTEPQQTALRIFGGDTGTDIAVLQGVTLNEDLLIDLGEGTNGVALQGVLIAHDFEYYGGNGTDVVFLGPVAAGVSPNKFTDDNIDLFLGGGDDVVVFTGPIAVTHRLAIHADGGNDLLVTNAVVPTFGTLKIEGFEVVV